MTPTVPRRASLAIGGMLIVTSSLLSAPIASSTPSSDAVSTINDRLFAVNAIFIIGSIITLSRTDRLFAVIAIFIIAAVLLFLPALSWS